MNSNSLPRTGDNDREHPYSNRHGDKHSRPCCHWRRSGRHPIAGSKAIRQGRGQGVDKKAPKGPWACPAQIGRQGRCGPARHHRLNRLLAPEHVREGRDLAR